VLKEASHTHTHTHTHTNTHSNTHSKDAGDVGKATRILVLRIKWR